MPNIDNTTAIFNTKYFQDDLIMEIEGIYLDYNATTPCDPQVVEKMLPFFNEIYGNPSNGFHRQGRTAAKAVDVAREQIANLIGSQPNEIIFTSGATESDNLAIFGVARNQKNNPRKRLVSSRIEHKAVLNPCKKLEEEGFEVFLLPVDSQGEVSIQQAKIEINDRTLLVSIHLANNEIGTIQAIQEITKIAHQKGALVHCDAAQAIGKIPVDVEELDVDLLSISAHKLYGPKGVGALYVRGGLNAIPLEPLLYGGGQEKGVRSGTTNVPGIVGFGEASRLATELVNEEGLRIANLRDLMEKSLAEIIPDMRINGHHAKRLPNTSSMTFLGIDADALLFNLPEVMMGTGSACTSGAIEPSHVLQAIGLSREAASSTVRASLGRFVHDDDIPLVCEYFRQALNRMKLQSA
jgi:cysteine desulfurase